MGVCQSGDADENHDQAHRDLDNAFGDEAINQYIDDRDIMPSNGSVAIPTWLVGLWSRSYIKQNFRDAKTVDNQGSEVLWLQGMALCVDMRIPYTLQEAKATGKFQGRGLADYTVEDVALLEEQECFAGSTRVLNTLQGDEIIEWRPLMEYPGGAPWPSAEDYTTMITASRATPDRGVARQLGVDPTSTRVSWLEHDVETLGKKLEEKWEMEPGTGAAQIDPSELSSVTDIERGAMFLRVGKRFARIQMASPGSPGWQAEFSQGIINGAGEWVVELSTLPHLEGSILTIDDVKAIPFKVEPDTTLAPFGDAVTPP